MKMIISLLLVSPEEEYRHQNETWFLKTPGSEQI